MAKLSGMSILSIALHGNTSLGSDLGWHAFRQIEWVVGVSAALELPWWETRSPDKGPAPTGIWKVNL